MKTIYILLTRSSTILSKMVHFVTDDTYTHASIAFEEDLKTLYTSSRKNGRTLLCLTSHSGIHRDTSLS